MPQRNRTASAALAAARRVHAGHCEHDRRRRVLQRDARSLFRHRRAPDEIAKLDTGVARRLAADQSDASRYWRRPTRRRAPLAVCRFYGVPAAGLDSHFYSASATAVRCGQAEIPDGVAPGIGQRVPGLPAQPDDGASARPTRFPCTAKLEQSNRFQPSLHDQRVGPRRDDRQRLYRRRLWHVRTTGGDVRTRCRSAHSRRCARWPRAARDRDDRQQRLVDGELLGGADQLQLDRMREPDRQLHDRLVIGRYRQLHGRRRQCGRHECARERSGDVVGAAATSAARADPGMQPDRIRAEPDADRQFAGRARVLVQRSHRLHMEQLRQLRRTSARCGRSFPGLQTYAVAASNATRHQRAQRSPASTGSPLRQRQSDCAGSFQARCTRKSGRPRSPRTRSTTKIPRSRGMASGPCGLRCLRPHNPRRRPVCSPLPSTARRRRIARSALSPTACDFRPNDVSGNNGPLARAGSNQVTITFGIGATSTPTLAAPDAGRYVLPERPQFLSRPATAFRARPSPVAATRRHAWTFPASAKRSCCAIQKRVKILSVAFRFWLAMFSTLRTPLFAGAVAVAIAVAAQAAAPADTAWLDDLAKWRTRADTSEARTRLAVDRFPRRAGAGHVSDRFRARTTDVVLPKALAPAYLGTITVSADKRAPRACQGTADAHRGEGRPRRGVHRARSGHRCDPSRMGHARDGSRCSSSSAKTARSSCAPPIANRRGARLLRAASGTSPGPSSRCPRASCRMRRARRFRSPTCAARSATRRWRARSNSVLNGRKTTLDALDDEGDLLHHLPRRDQQRNRRIRRDASWSSRSRRTARGSSTSTRRTTRRARSPPIRPVRCRRRRIWLKNDVSGRREIRGPQSPDRMLSLRTARLKASRRRTRTERSRCSPRFAQCAVPLRQRQALRECHGHSVRSLPPRPIRVLSQHSPRQADGSWTETQRGTKPRSPFARRVRRGAHAFGVVHFQRREFERALTLSIARSECVRLIRQQS